MNPAIVPFKLPHLFSGFAEGKGLAKASPSELTLEFVVKETVLDIFKTGIREIRIPQSEIASLALRQGWFKDKIHIRLKSLRWLAELPGGDTDELTLHVSRRDRSQATIFLHTLRPSTPPAP